MNRPEPQQLFATARAVLLGHAPDAWAIYVYGSYATGQANEQSDLDLAVLLPPGHALRDQLSLSSELAIALGLEVDVVDLQQASDVLRREVLEHGMLLYAADPDQVLGWEASALTRYGFYRQEVGDLLQDFMRTGVGYRP